MKNPMIYGPTALCKLIVKLFCKPWVVYVIKNKSARKGGSANANTNPSEFGNRWIFIGTFHRTLISLAAISPNPHESDIDETLGKLAQSL